MKLALYLLLINLATYLAYWLDKRAARGGGWRLPEATLLTFGFLGGWPAGLLAQQKLRHKTKKSSYQFKFWALVVVQIVLLMFPPEILRNLLTRAFS